MIKLITGNYKKSSWFIPVDSWVPEEQDRIFKTTKGSLNIPIDKILGIENNNFNTFILSTKRCYNGDTMLFHTPLYLNYFEKFYDPDHELLVIMCNIKYMIDYQAGYTKEMFFSDLNRYIMSSSIMMKAHMMNDDNYMLNLDAKKYRNEKNPTLQYSDKHAKLLMWMSLIVNMMIPLLTHFIYVNKITDTNTFLLEEFHCILDYIDTAMGVNLYNKLYATAYTNISKDNKDNSGLWEIQDIRGNNITTHSLDSVNNILLNIIPKYVYTKNIIFLNYTSIRTSTTYQITGIGYEYTYVSLSASKRDLDNNSEYDKFESYLVKQNEALYLQNKVSCEKTLEFIDYEFGPFDEKEIDFYIKRLEDDNHEVVNRFQQGLIFNLFYKYFGDPITLYAINKRDYVKLMIAAKKILLAYNMVILPYIVSSKVERIQPRKCINKKELLKIEASKYYDQIRNKYNQNDKIEKYILSIISTILVSDFTIIDYHDKSIDGKAIVNLPDIIGEEIMMYVSLI